MERTWRLSGLEYLVLRERLVDRKQSWPFTYITDIRGYYDFQFAKARVWGELQAAWDPALADVLVKSLQADIRMVVRAEDRSAARRIDGQIVMVGKKFGDRAVLIQGFSSTTTESHDELEITECDAASLTRLLVDKLPPMEAGSQPRVELLGTGGEQAEFDHWHGRGSLYDEGDRDVDARCRQWQAAPKATVGQIVITQGHSHFGPRGQVTKWLVWEDHPGDGRYVIGMEPPPAAVAADAARLRALVDRHCDELMLVRDDESRGGLVRASVYDDGR
ncbi:ESX secretion-associated protein EspG [Nocardia lijiangensis]|uniref:ESX secretion-associated protein EspG n=1 Tax=Nocardia lijiangensis TaxID=299618 RepID=UPI000829E76E|nr:ESX secretion-associated protein EspG [Nocardia lijiangensis]